MNFDTCDENIILGFIGALIGGLIGISLWIFCGYFGIIPGIVGFIFAFLTIKGYMILAGSISRKGLVGCIIICILLIIIAEFGVVMLTIFIDRKLFCNRKCFKNRITGYIFRSLRERRNTIQRLQQFRNIVTCNHMAITCKFLIID